MFELNEVSFDWVTIGLRDTNDNSQRYHLYCKLSVKITLGMAHSGVYEDLHFHRSLRTLYLWGYKQFALTEVRKLIPMGYMQVAPMGVTRFLPMRIWAITSYKNPNIHSYKGFVQHALQESFINLPTWGSLFAFTFHTKFIKVKSYYLDKIW